MQTEIGHRFSHHPPPNDHVVRAHEGVRSLCGELANYLQAMLPDGREKALAMTKLEETMFWSNAAIARNPDDVTKGRE